MNDTVKYAVVEQVATVALNRPEKYNTLRGDILQGLEEALHSKEQGMRSAVASISPAVAMAARHKLTGTQVWTCTTSPAASRAT